MKQTILVIEDEEDIRELLRYSLVRAGYDVATAADGNAGLAATASNPALILLDLMLPGLSGLEVAKRLKAESATADIPIVMVTAKGDETDIVAGLDLGADDYVTKPFSVKVLLARVAAVLRRGEQIEEEPNRRTVAGLVLDLDRREAFVDGEPVEMTFSEFAILDALLRRRGAVMTRQQIVADIRGGEITVTDRSVDVHMTAIRKKLGVYGPRLLTVRGVGYRFDV
jgi:two-component system phosphate regulon response regulator PhoB